MRLKDLPDLSIVLTFLRLGQGWGQTKLAEAAGLSPKVLNDLERGWRTLTRPKLEQLIAFMGLPPAAIDETLETLARNRAMARAPHPTAGQASEAQNRVEAIAAQAGKLARGFTRSTLTLLTVEGEALKARQHAEELWNRLKRRKPAERRKLVERGLEFHTWALCERVARESITAAPNQPQPALELAELALLIAELLPGDALQRAQTQSYAWAHVGNGRHVCNDLPGADEALARARKLWEEGTAGEPGFLSAAWLPWIEASLRRSQRRFSTALKQIDEALAHDQEGELRGEILLTKARIHQTLGDPVAAVAALSEAAPLIDAAREPRNAFGLRFNLLSALCSLQNFAEAALHLSEVRVLAERLGGDLDLTRVVWLEGKIAAGLGRLEDARSAFEQVRRIFLHYGLAFDYALVSLELALILLEQGRTAEVRTLAEEMLTIFQAQEVEREALAALRVFCDAAKREAATVELTRRVVKFLYRAQHDPELRFEPENGVEAR
ncbi:MAG TPA: helix-turn-helix domain-containing protein [Thermoanaerobaculia bacterium]|nr:helix-turn-helix domain-containing protein [Thermoanaerobaculia bacterium]